MILLSARAICSAHCVTDGWTDGKYMDLPTSFPKHIIPNQPFKFLPSAKKVVDGKNGQYSPNWPEMNVTPLRMCAYIAYAGCSQTSFNKILTV